VSGKILHIIGQLTCGGAQTQLSYLARALRERGWTQSVVSLSSGGVWKDYLSANNIPVFEIDRNPFKPYRLWRLDRIVRRERPQIVLAWSLYAGVYAHWLVGVGQPLEVLAVRGDLTVDSNTAQPSQDLLWGRRALEKADYIVSNSAWGLAVLRDKGLHLPHTSVISNIVFAAGRSNVSQSVSTPRIVAAGGLKRLKGHDVLLRALAIVAASRMKFELVLAGNGPEWTNLKRLAAELGLSEQVRFLGEVEDVSALLAGAQLAVHPARSEGLSNAILEAMAEGLPVIATAVGGTPEIIQDGQNGLLVPPDEPDCLADAILRLLRDGELRARLGQAALQWVRRSCAEDTIADEYEGVFCRLLHQSQKV
jgi:glycosyltransferase involved in cell wall biosynthesis